MPDLVTVGGGGVLKLAPDINYIANKLSPATLYYRISNIDVSAGFATALSLTGSFSVSYLKLTGLSNGVSASVRLTIDGVLIWDSSVTVSAGNISLFGSTDNLQEVMRCNSSLLLEVSQSGSSNVLLDYLSRPIL